MCDQCGLLCGAARLGDATGCNGSIISHVCFYTRVIFVLNSHCFFVRSPNPSVSRPKPTGTAASHSVHVYFYFLFMTSRIWNLFLHWAEEATDTGFKGERKAVLAEEDGELAHVTEIGRDGISTGVGMNKQKGERAPRTAQCVEEQEANVDCVCVCGSLLLCSSVALMHSHDRVRMWVSVTVVMGEGRLCFNWLTGWCFPLWSADCVCAAQNKDLARGEFPRDRHLHKTPAHTISSSLCLTHMSLVPVYLLKHHARMRTLGTATSSISTGNRRQSSEMHIKDAVNRCWSSSTSKHVMASYAAHLDQLIGCFRHLVSVNKCAGL